MPKISEELKDNAMEIAEYANNNNPGQKINIIMRSFSEEQQHIMASEAIKIGVNPRGTAHLMNLLPEEAKRDKFIIDTAKDTIQKCAEQGDGMGVLIIVQAFANRKQFIGELKDGLFQEGAISKLAQKGEGQKIAQIIRAFDYKEQKQLMQSAKKAIPILAEQGDGVGIGEIIKSFPNQIDQFKGLANEAIAKMHSKFDIGKIKEALPARKQELLRNVSVQETMDVGREKVSSSKSVGSYNTSPALSRTTSSGRGSNSI